MRELIKDFASIVSTTLPINSPIYEFGALQVAGQEGYSDLRPLFPGKEYVGCDMRTGLGVDMVLNLHEIELVDESVGSILCFDTLEHVEYPHKALNEMYRVLKPDGIAIISSVFHFPIHDYPYDYWRFTPEAFNSLLKPFKTVFVGSSGPEDLPHTVIGVGIKGKYQIHDMFLDQFRQWQSKWLTQEKISSVKHMKNLLIPPILRGKAFKKNKH